MSPVSGRGLHHVTVVATDPGRNLDFYRHVLGLRLEKRTVTHEDPGAYHLMYGQNDGRPGGHLTFFSWRSAAPAPRQPDDVEFLSFAVDAAALDWWEERLDRMKVVCHREAMPSGAPAITLQDPDGTALALVGGLAGRGGREGAGIPGAFAIHGLRAVALSLHDTDLMAVILTEVLGYAETGRYGDWTAFSAHDQAGGEFLLHRRGDDRRARLGAGSIHHVAFRTSDDETQARMAALLKSRVGIEASPVKDRFYFRSIYFRGPDGILIEMATDGPGLLIDEARDNLGERLVLPPGLEGRRDELLRLLPPLA